MTNDKTFRLYWLSGDTDTVTGSTIADAMNSAGYGGGAVRALDFYQQGEAQTYHWDNSKGGWIKNLEPEDADS
jgi:hypothetical protein